jgi:hypothetical protein
VLLEERGDLANAVGPRLGIPAGRGTAPSGGIHVDAFHDISGWPVAVERMVSPRIDLDPHRILGLLGGFGKFSARFSGGSVVVFSDENQQGGDGLVLVDVIRDRLARPSLAPALPAAVSSDTGRIKRHRSCEAGTLLTCKDTEVVAIQPARNRKESTSSMGLVRIVLPKSV